MHRGYTGGGSLRVHTAYMKRGSKTTRAVVVIFDYSLRVDLSYCVKCRTARLFQFRSAVVTPAAPLPSPTTRFSHYPADLDTNRITTGRRSKQAQHRAERMRRMYQAEGKEVSRFPLSRLSR